MFLVSNYYRMCCIILFFMAIKFNLCCKNIFLNGITSGGAVYRYHFIILTI